MRRLVRVLWPLGVALAVIVTVQVWWSRGYAPTGHAAGHFASASIVFAMAFVLTVLLWALPADTRRRPALWALLGLVALAAVVNTTANVQVVDAIGAERWSDETAGALGPTRPGFEEGHRRSEQAALTGVVVAAAVAIWLRSRGVVSTRLAVGAVVLCVLFPYWVFPGAGLILLAGVLAVRRIREELRATADHPLAVSAS